MTEDRTAEVEPKPIQRHMAKQRKTQAQAELTALGAVSDAETTYLSNVCVQMDL